jgi:ubiquinone/menaquinone biosynthesis C-methylase UbiE
VRRTVTAELLDTDSGTPDQIAASLADLRFINRNFGGISTTAALLQRVARERSLSRLTFLDVAGASGDVIAAAAQRLSRKGIAVEYTVADRARSHLNGPGIVADALQLPFADDSFDVVGCALFLHHLEPEQVTTFTREALRVARHAFIINDLRRSLAHLAFAAAGGVIYRSDITRHDSTASVRRAYTRQELLAMLRSAGAARIEISKHYFFRMGAIVWK